MADQTVDRYELHDDLACAGGTRQAFIRDWLQAGESTHRRGRRSDGDRGSESVGEPGTFELPVGMGDPIWDIAKESWVVRQVFENAPFVEWPIASLVRNLDDGGERFGVLSCRGVMQELMYRSALLERVEANESVDPHFELYQFPPTDHVDVILEAAPSFFSKGTIEPSVPVDMVYHRDTALSALKELAAVSEFEDGRLGAELRVRRNGTSSYLVDLLRQVGSSAAQVQIREAKQLLSTSTESDVAAVATRIYPKGGNTYAYEGSMARAQWEVAAQSGATLTMRDDIIGENDQLNDHHVLLPDGTSFEITDSIAPDTLVLASDPGDVVGDLLRFRRETSTGALAELSYLESPSGVSEWDTRSHELDRTDIPAIDNLVPDPFFLEWIGDLPRDVALVGSPNVARETDILYNRAGDASIHINALEGQGVERVPVSVIPTAERPFFVAQIQLWVVSGNVRLELVDVTNDQTFPPEDEEAVTVAEGVWIDSFGIAPGGDPEDNFFTRGTEQFAIRVIAEGGPAEFYLDAWMLLQQQSFAEEFYGGRASNDLWMLAKRALDLTDTPEQAYEVGLVDLYRLRQDAGGPTFHGEEIVVGGDCRVVAESIGVDFETRIVEVRRNWSREGDTKVTLESKTNDLTRLINPASRRNRKKLDTQVGQEVPLKTDCTNLVDPTQAEDEKCSTDSAGRDSFWTYPAIALAETAMEAGGTIGVGWDGKVSPTGGEGVTEGGEGETSLDGELKRVVAGLIAREQFNRDSIGPDWTIHDGTFSIRFVARNLYCAEGGLIEWTSLTPRGEQALQFIVRVNDMEEQNGEVYLRYEHNGGSPNAYLLRIGERLVGPSTGEPRLRLYLVEAGAETLIGSVKVDIDDGGPTQVIKFHVADGFQRVYMSEDIQGGVPATLKLETTDTTLDGTTGRVAVGATDATGEFTTFDDLIFCPHNRIDVRGLPTGYRVKTNAGAGPVTESGGEVLGFDILGTYFSGGTLTVDDGSEDQASLGGGIRGGDEFEYADVSGGETPQDDTSGFGLSALAALSFRDDEGTEIENTEGAHEGVKSSTYTRGQYTYTIPAGTVSIVPYGVRLGEAQGIACIQRVQVNQGNPCDFRISEVVESWRIPTDFGLVLDLPLDEREVPEGLYNYVDDDGCKTFTAADDSAIVSSRRNDRSGHDNHAMLYTWWWNDENGIMHPQPAAAYFGMGTNPDRQFDSSYHGCLSIDSDPRANLPNDQGDFEKCNGITVCTLLRPTINDVGTSGGEDIFGRWYPVDETLTLDQGSVDFKRHGFYVGLFADPDGVLMFVELPAGTGPTGEGYGRLFWPIDWTFGARPTTSEYVTIDKWIFFGLRVTDNVTTINIDMFVGDCETHKLLKLSPQLHVVDNLQSATYFENAYSLPPIVEDPTPTSRWVLGSRGHWEYDREDCLQSSDGQPGVYDEHKRWNRRLSDAEMRGLFLTVAGRRHTGDVLFPDQIFESVNHKL